MKIKLYVREGYYSEETEIYTEREFKEMEDERLYDRYEDEFCDFLTNNFSLTELFNMTAVEKAETLDDFKNYLVKEYYTIIEKEI